MVLDRIPDMYPNKKERKIMSIKRLLFLAVLIFFFTQTCVVFADEDESFGTAQVGDGEGNLGNQAISEGVASVEGLETQYIYDIVLPMTLGLLLAVIFGLVFAMVLIGRREKEYEYSGE